MSNYIVRNENGKYTVEENEKAPANSVLEQTSSRSPPVYNLQAFLSLLQSQFFTQLMPITPPLHHRKN